MSGDQRMHSVCPHCGAHDTEGPCFGQQGERPTEQLRREWAQWDELSKQWRKEFSEWLYGTPAEPTQQTSEDKP